LDLFTYNSIRHAELNQLFGCFVLGNSEETDEDDFEEDNCENDAHEAEEIFNEEYSNSESPLNPSLRGGGL